ncbi:MAG: sulfotransferase [Roseicyclus sp.]|nr:sulfotransferase [Roseicyclus sp.]MBO6625176.1 sulfotransferase [Roseicyclus sp.]MBO6924008.1 sulfotransferase [Roseicyclus sp.]
MAETAIMFGLGAAKAGTTWLYRYLAQHPDVAMPAVKELHWFDTCETGKWTRQVTRMERERARRTDRLPTGDAGQDRRLKREICGYDAWIDVLKTRGRDTAYVDFLRGTGAAKLTGDITPAYGTLGEDSLRRMERLGPVARFVFLMRDPLDRLWSNVRMVAARDAGDFAANAGERLDQVLDGRDEAAALRSDYATTLQRTARALNPANLFLGFYETLFDRETIAALCGFLGIAPRPAQTGVRVLPGTDLKMTEGQRRRALAWLAPQYAAVAARCGPLPRRWTEHMEALA